MKPEAPITAALLLLGWLGTGAAHALDATINPTVAASMGHDSNPSFGDVPRPSGRATGLLRLDLDLEGPRRTFDLLGSARHIETFGEPVFTGTAYTLRGGWIEEGERWTTNLAVTYIDQPTFQSEINEIGGVLAGQRRRILRPRFAASFDLGPTTRLFADLGLTQSRLIGDVESRLIDFDQDAVTAGIAWDFSERLRFSSYLSYLDFRSFDDTPGVRLIPENNALTYGVSGRIDYQFSESIAVNASVGVRRSDLEATVFLPPPLPPQIVEDTEDGYLLGFGVIKEAENWILEAGYDRTIEPTTVGFVVEQNVLRASWRAQFTERWRFETGASYLIADTVQQVPSPINRNLLRASVEALYTISERWTTSLRADYSWQEFRDEIINPFSDARTRLIVGLHVRYDARDLPLGM